MDDSRNTTDLGIYASGAGLLLCRMTEVDRDDFLGLQGKKYASSLLKSGMFDTFEIALEKASSQLLSILENEGEEHFFAWMRDEERDVVVGSLWWARRRQNNTVWIYDIEVNEDERRRGYARKCLKALEAWSLGEKVPSIALNVFAYNDGAEKLYREIGYEDVSKHMRKNL